MSRNNQILIKEYKGKWYVFDNIMAESWSERNCLKVKRADKRLDTIEEAYKYAHELDDTEYGVVKDSLAKDGASVDIIEG